MPETSSSTGQDPEEPVWTYRGYRLKTSEFVTAMVHLFRAEIQRANVWRQRLDTTTNWAVVATREDIAILMCALTVTDIDDLRKVIARIDPTAFVATSNACEMLRRGLQPLSSEQ